MSRDALFAKEVQRQCAEEQYVSFVNDGNTKVDEMVEMVALHLGLPFPIVNKQNAKGKNNKNKLSELWDNFS